MKPTFIDLFAGCGGLSEGFIQAGFEPLAHVEMDKAACFSLRTRMAFHWLARHKKANLYADYLNGAITREELYSKTPKHIINSVINAEISDKTIESIFAQIDNILGNKQLDLIVGGPPCQAYSLIGRGATKKNGGMRDDKRNWLFKYYIEFLTKYKPKHFVFENVLGLLSAKDRNGEKYFDTILKEFSKNGYSAVPEIISADLYGVPQSRKRVIIVGTRKDLAPIKLHLSPKKLSARIADLLADLPAIQAGDKTKNTVKAKKGCKELYDLKLKDDFPITLHKSRPHNERDLEIYRIAVEKWNNGHLRLNYNDLPNKLQTHRNRTAFTDRFKVVAGDLLASHTVVAHISRDGHYYIHPDIKQNRSITPREAARLQTFPDNYYFESADDKECLSSAFKQIGNAVPVYLAKQIAESIGQDMKSSQSKKC